MTLFRLRRSLIELSLATALIAGGCKPGEPSSANTTTDAEGSQVIANLRPATQDDLATLPIAIPDGTSEELFTFIDGLDRELDLNESGGAVSGNSASGDSELSANAQQAIGVSRVMEARIGACDKILARQVPEDTRLRAISIQLDALRTLAALDPDGNADRFDRYTERIIAGSDPLLARMSKATRFQSEVNHAITGAGPSNDQVISALQALLDDPDAGPETLNATREAAGWLARYGDLPTAAKALRLIGKRFQDHSDTHVADEGKALISQSINLELTQLARGVAEGKTEALEDLLTKVRQLLVPENDDPDILAYAMQSAQLLEFSGHPKESLQAYELIGERFESHADASLVADVRHSIQLASRRLNLIGKSLTVDGVQLDGRSFDWETYRGKWVIVCFWATWNQNWLNDVETIHRAIGNYQDSAVEVVAISLDDDRNQLERYLKEHRTYWPVLVNADPTQAGFENPNAVRCGVEAVPFILLVDPEGQVVDIHLMGERLAAALAEHVKP